VKVLACPDDQFDAATGTCATQVWIDQPVSIWSGWTQADLHAFAAGVLGLLACWLVLRTVLKLSGEIT